MGHFTGNAIDLGTIFKDAVFKSFTTALTHGRSPGSSEPLQSEAEYIKMINEVIDKTREGTSDVCSTYFAYAITFGFSANIAAIFLTDFITTFASTLAMAKHKLTNDGEDKNINALFDESFDEIKNELISAMGNVTSSIIETVPGSN